MENNNELSYSGEAPITIKPSHWYWIWPSVPWLALVIMSTILDLAIGSLPIILAAMFVLPRYLGWKKASYVLYPNYLLIIKGSGKNKVQELPLQEISRVWATPGFFGEKLRYTSVHLARADGATATLTYVPKQIFLENQIQDYVNKLQ
jgi:hypothetical protein